MSLYVNQNGESIEISGCGGSVNLSGTISRDGKAEGTWGINGTMFSAAVVRLSTGTYTLDGLNIILAPSQYVRFIEKRSSSTDSWTYEFFKADNNGIFHSAYINAVNASFRINAHFPILSYELI